MATLTLNSPKMTLDSPVGTATTGNTAPVANTNTSINTSPVTSNSSPVIVNNTGVPSANNRHSSSTTTSTSASLQANNHHHHHSSHHHRRGVDIMKIRFTCKSHSSSTFSTRSYLARCFIIFETSKKSFRKYKAKLFWELF